MDAYVYVKQRKGTQSVHYIYKHFLGPDYVARQATEAEDLSL